MATPVPWKHYPYTPDWGDPRYFTFPDIDGHRPDLGMSTYFMDGFVRGTRTGRQYAFMTVFNVMAVFRRCLRVDFFSFALFDCDTRRYGTYTDYDFPRPPKLRRRYKVSNTPGHATLHYETPTGTVRWDNQQEGDGTLRPFAYTLDLRGTDQQGAAMGLTLDVDAHRPPAPLGGRELGGEMMFLGAERTYSYFQSGLAMRGEIVWGDVREEVEGAVGWIDRQWAVEDFTLHQDRHSSTYRNEWRVMQFANGWDLSCFHQYARRHGRTVVPWAGCSAQGPGPEFELKASHRVELEIPEFIRSPGVVRARMMLTEGPRWFPQRYRLRVPEWEMDVSSEPLVDAPAHAFPIEWWTGPVRIKGRLFGQEVSGLGFDERSCPFVRPFEVAQVLRLTVEHLEGIDDGSRRTLSYRAWEVEALALRGDPRAALVHCRQHIESGLPPQPASVRNVLEPIVADLRTVLEGRFKVR